LILPLKSKSMFFFDSNNIHCKFNNINEFNNIYNNNNNNNHCKKTIWFFFEGNNNFFFNLLIMIIIIIIIIINFTLQIKSIIVFQY